jgi:hypothetical protein
VLVAVAGPVSNPQLLYRRRIELADHLPSQPYHEAVKLHDLTAAAALIERAREDASARARAALSTAIAEMGRKGYDVRGAALLTSQARALPSLGAILMSHPLLHTAEGELFRSALARACEHHRLSVGQYPAGNVYDRVGRSLSLTPAALRTRVAAIGRSVGRPWTADQKTAFLAGWCLLAS